jgi:hypothetical protein
MSKKDKIVRPFVITKDPMIQDLLRKFSERSDKGISDYKVTMVQATKPITQWIEDAQEELWDGIVYLEKIKSLLTKVNKK